MSAIINDNKMLIEFSTSEIIVENRLETNETKDTDQGHYVIGEKSINFFGGIDKIDKSIYKFDIDALDIYKKRISCLPTFCKMSFKNNMDSFDYVCKIIATRKMKPMFSPDKSNRAIIFNKDKDDDGLSDYDVYRKLFYDNISCLEIEKINNEYILRPLIRETGTWIKFFNKILNNSNNSFNISNNDKLSVNRMIYGAPGTGKSHRITEDIKKSIPNYSQSDYNGEDVFRTTLHPEYSYYDFVGSVKPKVEKKDGKEVITYEFTQGIFTKALIQAFKNYYKPEKKPVFLVLEEMSRANVAAVFGDIFQLLDRNDKNEPGRSEYRIKNDDILNALKDAFKDAFKDNNDTNEKIKNMNEIYIPSNLYIWGTVNTSDQNVYVMDNAFKRRFNPEYESINAVKYENGNYKNNYNFLFAYNNKRVSWVQFYQNLDEYIVTDLNLPEDKQLGQFYIQFRNPKEQNPWDDDLKGASIRNKVDIFYEDIKSYGQAFEAYANLLKGEDVKVFSDTFIQNVIEKKNESKEQEN